MDICDLCQQEITESICGCTYPPPRLCDECYEKHKQKVQGMHYRFPVRYRMEGDLKKRIGFAQRKLQDLVNAENAAIMQLRRVGELENMVFSSAALLIREIEQKRDQAIAAVRGEKVEAETQLQAALKTTRDNAIEPDYVPANELEQRLWQYSIEHDNSPPLSLKRFTYIEQFNRFRELLTLPQDLKLHSKKVAVIDITELRVFDTTNQSWSRAVQVARDLPLVFHFNCFLANGNLFHCGGSYSGIASAEVFEIDVTSGEVTVLQPMQTAREGHGGVKVKDCVYVFGGKIRDSFINSAEKFDVQAKTWQQLPPMHEARMNFTPCRYKSRIYLCGGFTLSIEEFDLGSNQYRTLQHNLSEKSKTVTILVGNELVILTSLKKHSFNPTTNSFAVVATSPHNIDGFLGNEMTPVVAEGVAYLPGWRGVKCFDINTCAVSGTLY